MHKNELLLVGLRGGARTKKKIRKQMIVSSTPQSKSSLIQRPFRQHSSCLGGRHPKRGSSQAARRDVAVCSRLIERPGPHAILQCLRCASARPVTRVEVYQIRPVVRVQGLLEAIWRGTHVPPHRPIDSFSLSGAGFLLEHSKLDESSPPARDPPRLEPTNPSIGKRRINGLGGEIGRNILLNPTTHSHAGDKSGEPG
jgi:hypothetical protein